MNRASDLIYVSHAKPLLSPHTRFLIIDNGAITDSWSSLVHATIMGIQAVGDSHESGHLMGDVPAMVFVAVVLWYFSNSKE